MKPSWTGRIACPECALTIQREECGTEDGLLADLIAAWNRRHDAERIVADLMRLAEDPWQEELCDDWGHRGVVIRAFCDALADTYKRGETLTKPEGESHVK
jgi:hypothetical protein